MGSNWHHSNGDTDDPNYGFRWAGTLGKVEYSLAYYQTLNLDPVVNTIFNPFGDAPLNGFAGSSIPKWICTASRSTTTGRHPTW